MDNQSLYSILYTFLGWHPARIKTFANLICRVVQAKTVKIKELAIYVGSKGNLHAKVIKVERFFLNQVIDFICFGKIILKLFQTESQLKLAIDRTNWQFGGNYSLPLIISYFSVAKSNNFAILFLWKTKKRNLSQN